MLLHLFQWAIIVSVSFQNSQMKEKLHLDDYYSTLDF